MAEHRKIRQLNIIHELHIGLRPDIHKAYQPVMSCEEFRSSCEEDTALIAETDNHIVGLVLFSYRSEKRPTHVERHTLFLDVMVIDQSYRKSGIGRNLFAHLEQICREKKLDAIELQVNARNRDAYEIYRHIGFSEKSINMELLPPYDSATTHPGTSLESMVERIRTEADDARRVNLTYLSDEEYVQYLKWHEMVCEKPEVLGMSNHLLFVGKTHI